MRSGFDEKEYG